LHRRISKEQPTTDEHGKEDVDTGRRSLLAGLGLATVGATLVGGTAGTSARAQEAASPVGAGRRMLGALEVSAIGIGVAWSDVEAPPAG
jgi:hypothetical protein